MNKWIIIIIAAVVVIALGWYFWPNDATAPGNGTVDEASQVTESESQIDAESTSAKIVGRWQSTQDEKAVIVFNADGTTQDLYDGEAVSSGTWQVDTVGVEGIDFNPTGVFRHSTSEGQGYDYAVLAAGDTQLTLSYLARGNTLNYVRVE